MLSSVKNAMSGFKEDVKLKMLSHDGRRLMVDEDRSQ